MLTQEMRTLTAADTTAVSEVIDLAMGYMTALGRARAERGDTALRTALADGELIRSTFCKEASDSITRAALELGIVATREVHDDHHLTSFGDPSRPPQSEDLLLDLTWGQYRKSQSGSTYFGSRADLGRLVPDAHVAQFSTTGIAERQTVYTPGTSDAAYATWLRYVPTLPSGTPVLGEVDKSDYPDADWTDPYYSQPSIW